MTAEEARNSRYSAEDEKPGHKNTFFMLVSYYIYDIERQIRKVMRYTDATVYSLKDWCNRKEIVMPVIGHCSKFNVKWSSIEAIENVEWMCGMDNGAFNMLHRPKRHEENLKHCHGSVLEKFEYVKKHLDQFF